MIYSKLYKLCISWIKVSKIKWGSASGYSCSRDRWSDSGSIPRYTPDGSSARIQAKVCNCCLLKTPWGRWSRYCWRPHTPSLHLQRIFACYWSCFFLNPLSFGLQKVGFRSWVGRPACRHRPLRLTLGRWRRRCWRRWWWSYYTHRRNWSWGPFRRGEIFRIIYIGTVWFRKGWWVRSDSSPESPWTSDMRRWCTRVRWRR